MAVIVFCDGAARPNPGKGGIGIVFSGDKMNYTISEKCVGDKLSNNFVEYASLCRALEDILSYHFEDEEVTIYSDSELLVLQMNGEKKIDRGGKYVSEYLRAKKLAGRFLRLSFHWVSRNENTEANMLASKAVIHG